MGKKIEFIEMPDGTINFADVAESNGVTLAEAKAIYNAQIKRSEINTKTESNIFNALGVETKEQALIKQISALSSAVAFLATKTDKRTLNAQEKVEIQKQLAGFANIQKAVADGKKAKAKL